MEKGILIYRNAFANRRAIEEILRRYCGEGISYGKKLKRLQEDRGKEEELDQTMLGSI